MENEENKKIASISISGEITLNLHSLNNEGGEGNQIMTRQVTIIDKENKESTQTGISGDMFKHIHAGHMINYCVENGISLCAGCKMLNPNRIGIDPGFISILKGIDPEQFNETDSNLYKELSEKRNLISDEKSTEYKDITKQMKDIERKYIILKITDESDRKMYEDCNEIIATKLKKSDGDYANKKNEQDEAKKKKNEIENKYNLDFTDEEKINKMIESCAIDDAHGILVTSEKNNLPRKSVIEFAWSVGIPNMNNTETYLHTKVVADAGAKGSATGSNEGQNIFHRPLNYGAYAFICSIDVYRIGLNDISRKYPITDEERAKRYRAVIQSLLSTILNPKGAMTSMQKPHITDFKGVVSISHKLIPAPTISAINPKYKEEIQTIATNLNKIEKDAIDIKQFDGMGEFSEVLTSLYNAEPYKLG
jgi:CRISPR-associated autoregulator DevR family